MRSLLAALFVCALATPLCAEPTPLTQPLVEERDAVIECALTTPPPRTNIQVLENTKDAQATVGTYHYKLWIPKGYNADPQKRWPCIFIMSPGGNASYGNMKSYLFAHDFVVVMLVEAKNGPWPPIVGNFLAAHDDVIQRVRILEGRKYATGVSGGARASSVFVQARPGFCGLVLQAAGPAQDAKGVYLVNALKANPKLATVLTMGNADPNKKEEAQIKKVLPAARFTILNFEAGHSAAPPELFGEAMDWIEKTNGAAK